METGQHLTKMPQSLLFIGLPDGEVFLYHLTRDLTEAPPFIASYAMLRRKDASPPTFAT